MNPRFAVAVRVSAEWSLGCMSPMSGYQYAFGKCVATASVPQVYQSLEIRAILIVFSRLSFCDAVVCDVTFTEEGV